MIQIIEKEKGASLTEYYMVCEQCKNLSIINRLTIEKIVAWTFCEKCGNIINSDTYKIALEQKKRMEFHIESI